MKEDEILVKSGRKREGGEEKHYVQVTSLHTFCGRLWWSFDLVEKVESVRRGQSMVPC